MRPFFPDRCALLVEQTLLDLKSIGIAAERSVRPDNAVAGDQDGDVVRAIGRPRRPDRARLADCCRDLRVGARLAGRNAPQGLPHRFLKRGALHIEWDVRVIARTFYRRNDLRQQPGKRLVPSLQRGLRKARPQRLFILAERQAAYTLFGRGDEHLPKRGGHDRPTDRHAPPAMGPCRRGHAQSLPGCRIETRWPGKAGIIDRIAHLFRIAQRLRHSLFLQCLGIGSGRKTSSARKNAVEMRRRITATRSKVAQGQWLSRCLDRFDGHQYRALIARRAIGRAA